MKRNLITLFFAAATISSFATEPTRYELDVKDFTELKVTDGINVDYKCNPDSAGKAVFNTSPELASAIYFVPGKSKLEIQLATKENGKYEGLPTVTVYSNFLSKVENSGDSLVRVVSLAPGPKLKARVIGNGHMLVRNVKANQVDASIDTGNGTITIYGSTDHAQLSTTGKGNIQADALTANTVKCSLWGTGSIGCNPKDELSVMGAGSGTVYYKGKPTIKNRSVGVKTSPIDPADEK